MAQIFVFLFVVAVVVVVVMFLPTVLKLFFILYRLYTRSRGEGTSISCDSYPA